MAKNILITGTSSGFGRDTAETLAKAGHRVFATMRNATTRNKEKAEALSAKGIQVVELDVTDDDSVERGVKTVLEQAGHIDVVVNNAGIVLWGSRKRSLSSSSKRFITSTSSACSAY